MQTIKATSSGRVHIAAIAVFGNWYTNFNNRMAYLYTT
jgi:hypothetical protein